MFMLTGCTSKENVTDSNASARLQKITGKIVKSNMDKDGNIIIKENDITDKVVYISYEYEGVTIGLLALNYSNENVKVVINACQSCGGSPYAYFVQVGNKIQYQNCGNMFAIDELDNLVEDGCNPIAVEDKQIKDGIISIGTKQVKELKDKFENWKEPRT
jgi:uncharacterized membrane protein